MKYTLGIDISTEKMGFCLLEETAPAIYGQFRLKGMEYQGTAGKLIFNAQELINTQFCGALFSHLKGRTTQDDEFRVVVECSAIVNGRAVGTIRKLAMYSGMVIGIVKDLLASLGVFRPELKIIAPDEWQRQAFTGIYADITDFRGILNHPKAKSLTRASKVIKDITRDMDDMADAYNMASVYDLVEDINIASNRAKLERLGGERINQMKLQKRKLILKLNDYKLRMKFSKAKKLVEMKEKVEKNIKILDYKINQNRH